MSEKEFDKIVSEKYGRTIKEKRIEKYTNIKLTLYYLDTLLPEIKDADNLTLEELRSRAYAVKHVATYNHTTKRGYLFDVVRCEE